MRETKPAVNPLELTGPFIIKLRTPAAEGRPEGRVRFILGGGRDAEQGVSASMEEIGQLPDGLSIRELGASARIIFSSHGLVRVDF